MFNIFKKNKKRSFELSDRDKLIAHANAMAEYIELTISCHNITDAQKLNLISDSVSNYKWNRKQLNI